MGKRVAVRYMVMQGIKAGISGFYEDAYNSKHCAEPNKPYDDTGKNNFCHTIGDELDELAQLVGFKKRDDFAKDRGNSAWLNDYGEQLSEHVKEVLETTGLDWIVNGEQVHFYSPPGEFVLWPKSKYQTELS